MAGSPLILSLCRCIGSELTHDLERRRRAAILGDHTKAVVKRQEETMIRTIMFALFGLALASAAQAMPISQAHQPTA